MANTQPVIPRIAGEVEYFVGGAVHGALVASLIWSHWRLLGGFVALSGLALMIMHFGYALRHGRPKSSASIQALHKALSDVLTPDALRMSWVARLSPLFGAGFAFYVLVVSEYGDGRPFTW